jgi:hypothetical protein
MAQRRRSPGVMGMLLAFAGLSAVQAAEPPPLELKVLSSRPEFVSGGDALIEVRADPTKLVALTLTLNGNDVSRSVAFDDESKSWRGVIGGLAIGANTLVAAGTRPNRVEARLMLTNHPGTGPILSGPHLTPYECRTLESGLGAPLDANCSAAPRVEYFYKAADGAFKPTSGTERPTDMVTTTTNSGATVPYLVRVESGTINRTIYRIAILDEPQSGSGQLAQWRPGAGWNRKLAVNFGGGAGTQYHQGSNQAKDALNDLYLARGFAYLIATELVNQLHGNAVLQGEALMMLKEHFIERYGVPKWTVGDGGSGGAIQQLVITQIYPGLLDGLQPSASFPDSSLHTADCGLLQNFWRKADVAVWTDAKKQAVEGFTTGTCALWERTFVRVVKASYAPNCALSDTSQIYDPIVNPRGVRCTMQEMRVNIYGRDPRTGFARKPQDNVGLQYGLAALNNGAISVEEFLDLNERIGGNDIDGNFIAERSVADPMVLKALYASGLLNSGGGGLANVPILHSRGYTDAVGDIHDRHRDLTIRARLEKANGRSDNQVIWIGPARVSGEQQLSTRSNLAALSLDTMSKWLDAIASDPAPLSADKIVRLRPADAVDSCWSADGERFAERASFEGSGKCHTLYPVHGEPRLVAGAPLTNDIAKCRLKPIRVGDYTASFTPAQKQRLAAIFPDGVCDFSKPGVGQVGLQRTYRSYPAAEARTSAR